ncbi:Gluconate 2-dehydrogenase subunit 3 [Muriicola jejuensis]|uniref:Gluconate 2-dehydrogenase subunit 3 family protein n=1 Tax=Muriicola jejuensis TaxID=504488 RepID=A0A6P0UB00_9FLAO|nr:gluconate 2-dehydrogenase subunit 3 family protein [Muriicola jejuensis]NER09772.1 gluconate 2-dehydrogenase subunit 3 family protein [Muriicola jejuensis]SMP05905.1 Gluconate 2-dehydrogenase subunit 3 [Muriicola jejuensis]
MDRRIALKNMGLALGYTIATPTLLSLVQGCKEADTVDWTPDFFTKEEGKVLIQLVDIILPKTDTPSASEVNVHVFIDRFTNEIMEDVQRDMTQLSLNKFIEKALKDSGKEKADDLTAEDLEPVLAAALNVTEEEEIENMELMIKNTSAASKGENDAVPDEVMRFSFAKNLRDMTIWGYKTSEYVGENVLAYLPIPGEYIPCGDVNELTGGKDWSL